LVEHKANDGRTTTDDKEGRKQAKQFYNKFKFSRLLFDCRQLISYSHILQIWQHQAQLNNLLCVKSAESGNGEEKSEREVLLAS